MAKSYEISKKMVWEAYQSVKANKGAFGVDGESIQIFEDSLKDNSLQDMELPEFGKLFSTTS